MKIYFNDHYDRMRELAEVETPNSADELFKAVMQEANKFCAQHNFQIPYVRMWAEERDGVPMTKFDVGSHTEFFYADAVIE